jgi:hypothetical protein
MLPTSTVLEANPPDRRLLSVLPPTVAAVAVDKTWLELPCVNVVPVMLTVPMPTSNVDPVIDPAEIDRMFPPLAIVAPEMAPPTISEPSVVANPSCDPVIPPLTRSVCTAPVAVKFPVRFPPIESVPIVVADSAEDNPPVLIVSDRTAPSVPVHVLAIEPAETVPTPPETFQLPPLTAPVTRAEESAVVLPVAVSVNPGLNAPLICRLAIDGAVIVLLEVVVQDAARNAVIGTALLSVEFVTAPAVIAIRPGKPAPIVIVEPEMLPSEIGRARIFGVS